MREEFRAAGHRPTYREDFADGPGGWCCWSGPGQYHPPDVRDGVLTVRSPWGVDPNHAPPGAGYLTLLTFIFTSAGLGPDFCRPNRFVDGGYSRDLTDARMTVRLRGDVDLRGSRLTLLAQARLEGTTANYILTKQPFAITPGWSDQLVVLAPDRDQWVCIGARHDASMYGYADVVQALKNVDVDLILVLFPLTVVPLEPVKPEDLHRLRAHKDYQPDQRFLPRGEVQIDAITIEYPA